MSEPVKNTIGIFYQRRLSFVFVQAFLSGTETEFSDRTVVGEGSVQTGVSKDKSEIMIEMAQMLRYNEISEN